NMLFFFSSRRRHTRSKRDWSSDVCSSDLQTPGDQPGETDPDADDNQGNKNEPDESDNLENNEENDTENDENLKDLEDNDPENAGELPKTGQKNQRLYILISIILAGIGFILLKVNKAKKI